MKKKFCSFFLTFFSIILSYNFGLAEGVEIIGKVNDMKAIKHNQSNNYRDRKNYNNIHIITESDKRYHPVGCPIPIKLTVINNSGKPLIYKTKERRKEKKALATEQLPAYDLIFSGYVVDKTGNLEDYHWYWSKHTKDVIVTEIILEPKEKAVLIETIWEPPKIRFIQGGFKIRFADFEFPTGIRIELPKR